MKLTRTLRSLSTLTTALLLGLSSPSAQADFARATEYIDTDGSLLGYINFAGDGEEIARELNAIYAQVLASNPQMPPVPFDFNQFFTNLGFGSLEGFALSSKEMEPGLHRNRSVTLFDGAPAGILALYGHDTVSFRAAALAPADASGAITLTADFRALREVVVRVLQQMMGPMGEDLVRQQLSQTVPTTSLSYNQIIESLSGRVDAFWRQSYDADFQPEIDFWAEFEGAADLLRILQPWLTGQGARVIEEGDLLRLDLTPLLGAAEIDLYAETAGTSGHLRLYSSLDWNHQSEGPRLINEPHFAQLASKLPSEGIAFGYSGKTNLEPMLAGLTMLPEVAPYTEAIEAATDFLIGPYLEPYLSVTTMPGEDVMVTDQLAGYSTKQVVMALPALVGGGLTAAMAVPAFQKVREQSQEKAVNNNLRMIASAADQYFLENGVTEVAIEELTGSYIGELKPVAGESYRGMVIRQGEPIRVTLGNGKQILLEF